MLRYRWFAGLTRLREDASAGQAAAGCSYAVEAGARDPGDPAYRDAGSIIGSNPIPSGSGHEAALRLLARFAEVLSTNHR